LIKQRSGFFLPRFGEKGEIAHCFLQISQNTLGPPILIYISSTVAQKSSTMACTSATAASFEEDNMRSLGDLSIDLGLGSEPLQMSSVTFGASSASSSLFGASHASLYQCRWESDAAVNKVSAELGRGGGGEEVKRRHSIGDTSILSSINSPNDVMVQEPSPPPRTEALSHTCTTTTTTVAGVKQQDKGGNNIKMIQQQQYHHHSSSFKKNENRPSILLRSNSPSSSSHAAPPRMPSRMLSRRKICQSLLEEEESDSSDNSVHTPSPSPSSLAAPPRLPSRMPSRRKIC
jgi:hypothetical protein